MRKIDTSKITVMRVRRRSTSAYLDELREYAPLGVEEEVELFERYRAGDLRAKEEIILRNLRFVVSVAKHYQGIGLEIEDLISSGNIGLIKAVERYNPDKGFRFISYAVWWIRQEIISYIKEYKERRQISGDMEKKIASKEGELFRRVHPDEVLNRRELRQYQWLNRRILSLDAPLNEDDFKLLDILGEWDKEKEEYAWFWERVRKVLNEKEWDVLVSYYGLFDAPKDSTSLSVKYGVSRETIRHYLQSAKKKILDHLGSELEAIKRDG